MEPTPETLQTIGKLCGAWSFLESETERTLLGILKIDKRLSKIFVWKMGMRDRWPMIVREAKNELTQDKVAFLTVMKKNIEVAMRDRNIIVHGLVHTEPKDETNISTIPHEELMPDMVSRVPCWTIFMNEGRGKNYEISSNAVSVVFNNIVKIGQDLFTFNEQNNFAESCDFNDFIEKDWPTPL